MQYDLHFPSFKDYSNKQGMRENTYIHPLVTFPKGAFQRQYLFVKNIVFMKSSGEKRIQIKYKYLITNTAQIPFKQNRPEINVSAALHFAHAQHPLSSKG